jgi:hypothetical protein
MRIISGQNSFIQNEVLLLDFFEFQIQKNPLFPRSEGEKIMPRSIHFSNVPQANRTEVFRDELGQMVYKHNYQANNRLVEYNTKIKD